jgi:hypothetical protein
MDLLDPTIIRDNVDYSFGDQSGVFTVNGYMKVANSSNSEFLALCEKFKKTKGWMSIFIDNFRLYKSETLRLTKIELIHEYAKIFKENKIKELESENLLDLLSTITDLKFIIFTGFEDTPINHEIFEKIPDNVIGIYASNSIEFGGKVHPIPYGLQRKLTPSDNRHELIRKIMNIDVVPEKLLYLNHSIGSNPDREGINNFFQPHSWSTIDSPSSINSNDYLNYLNKIKKHKFMICPDGNAIGCECSRDWEVIYMRRVPVVLNTKYLRNIFKNIPVLFVNSFYEVTEDFLIKNDYLFHEMQNFDLSLLSMKEIFNKILKENNLC